MTSPGPAPLPGPHPVPGTPDPAPENGVSFVVPVYNKARVLPPVLDAMAAQQGDFPREFIFVDDGSTDDSLDVVRAGTAGWDNVQIICQENAGSAAATNTGISAARMPFLKFIDADVNVFLVVRSGVIAFPVFIIATVGELANVAIVMIRQPVDVLVIQPLVPPQIADEFIDHAHGKNLQTG